MLHMGEDGVLASALNVHSHRTNARSACARAGHRGATCEWRGRMDAPERPIRYPLSAILFPPYYVPLSATPTSADPVKRTSREELPTYIGTVPAGVTHACVVVSQYDSDR
jgi:hypothetical protein